MVLPIAGLRTKAIYGAKDCLPDQIEQARHDAMTAGDEKSRLERQISAPRVVV